jgi:nitrogen regulatory protein PII
MEYQTQKLITCILPKGIALDVIKLLKEQYDIVSANINNARGVGKITPLIYRGIGAQSEKEILTVVVKEDIADELFEFIYNEANINRPHGGLMFMNKLSKASIYRMPEVEPENK